MTRRAVFLDRDGTLNRELDFVTAPERIEVLPGAVLALRRLRDAGFALVVVTNQSGVARGMFDEARLAAIHGALHRALDGLPDAYFHCPHLPGAEGPYGRACSCRKPSTGLIETAAEVLGLALPGSFVVGDSARDIAGGTALGLGTVLVRSGKPWREALAELTAAGTPPDHVADGIAQAADWILTRRG